jgi:hypothetical protein
MRACDPIYYLFGNHRHNHARAGPWEPRQRLRRVNSRDLFRDAHLGQIPDGLLDRLDNQAGAADPLGGRAPGNPGLALTELHGYQ